jgi:hypothetical protein
MQSIAAELASLVHQYTDRLKSLPENEVSIKPSPVKWSKKEILGHLIDSAQNNIRRFIVSQYEENPFIRYNQDKWVSISNYQEYNYTNMVALWQLLNLHIVQVLQHYTPEMAKRTCQIEKLYDMELVATDYIKHLKHHLHQVLDLEPVAYP